MSLDWPPLKMPRLAPPKSCKYENHIKVLRHLDFFWSWGGPVWDSNVFSKSVTYRPTLSKFKGGPVKKNTLCKQLDDLLFHNSWSLLVWVFFQDAQLRDGETGSIFVQQVLHILFSKGIFWQSKAIISTTCAIRSDKCCLVMLVSCEKDEKWRKERSLVIK